MSEEKTDVPQPEPLGNIETWQIEQGSVLFFPRDNIEITINKKDPEPKEIGEIGRAYDNFITAFRAWPNLERISTEITQARIDIRNVIKANPETEESLRRAKAEILEAQIDKYTDLMTKIKRLIQLGCVSIGKKDAELTLIHEFMKTYARAMKKVSKQLEDLHEKELAKIGSTPPTQL